MSVWLPVGHWREWWGVEWSSLSDDVGELMSTASEPAQGKLIMRRVTMFRHEESGHSFHAIVQRPGYWKRGLQLRIRRSRRGDRTSIERKSRCARVMFLFLAIFVACSPTTGLQEEGSRNVGNSEALPVGLQEISNRSFNQIVEDGWRINGDGNNQENMQIVADQSASGARATAPNALQIVYPTGHKGGSAPHNRTWRSVSEHQWDEISVSVWVKYSENWTGHGSGVNKIIFLPQDGYAAGPLFMLGRGSGTGPMSLEFDIQSSRFENRNLKPNRSSGELVRGKWHRVDMYAQFNSGNKRDGQVRFWVDGILAGEYNDVMLSTASDPKVWGVVKIDAIWGGVGGNVPKRQTLSIDDLVVSGG